MPTLRSVAGPRTVAALALGLSYLASSSGDCLIQLGDTCYHLF